VLKRFKLSDRVSLIQEAGVANFMRCNIWHVMGRDFDLVIDTGFGLNPLKAFVQEQTGRPIKAIVTHTHFDHSGSLHEFDCRLGHRAEADLIGAGGREAVLFGNDWAEIEIVDPKMHPDYAPERFAIKAAPLTGYLDEGDVIDLGDAAYQVLHLPGHSPGSIGLWDVKARVLFSGDALYDGDLLDNLVGSDPSVYAATMERLIGLGAEVVHAGHFPSFGAARLETLARAYLAGGNRIGDVMDWYRGEVARGADFYADQDWTGAHVG